jgi:hypothetical protein
MKPLLDRFLAFREAYKQGRLHNVIPDGYTLAEFIEYCQREDIIIRLERIADR